MTGSNMHLSLLLCGWKNFSKLKMQGRARVRRDRSDLHQVVSAQNKANAHSAARKNKSNKNICVCHIYLFVCCIIVPWHRQAPRIFLFQPGGPLPPAEPSHCSRDSTCASETQWMEYKSDTTPYWSNGSSVVLEPTQWFMLDFCSLTCRRSRSYPSCPDLGLSAHTNSSYYSAGRCPCHDRSVQDPFSKLFAGRPRAHERTSHPCMLNAVAHEAAAAAVNQTQQLNASLQNRITSQYRNNPQQLRQSLSIYDRNDRWFYSFLHFKFLTSPFVFQSLGHSLICRISLPLLLNPPHLHHHHHH
jgi:hypothetical protein